MTEKLYYSDSHVMSFNAKVLASFPFRGMYASVLDRTAFFPEGGGQRADTGYIGDAFVSGVTEVKAESIAGEPDGIAGLFQAEDKIILHFSKSPLESGREYQCRIDGEQRLRRMQNHSGEHIVSGLVHGLFGYDNVGFHMSEGFMTIDFSGELTWEQLADVERRANETVRADIEIHQIFPSEDELESMKYRSKLELTENVRIVEIPGVDCCACCAPHAKRTGEIGLIKILTAERHRGGMRITLTCGMDALDECRLRQRSVTEISEMLSAKKDDVSRAVRRLADERDSLKQQLVLTESALVKLIASQIMETEGNICLFESLRSEVARRELVNSIVGKCGGVAAVFSGDDANGYCYVIGSANVDLRKNCREINCGIDGRGGGRTEMITGLASGSEMQIRTFFERSFR